MTLFCGVIMLVLATGAGVWKEFWFGTAMVDVAVAVNRFGAGAGWKFVIGAGAITGAGTGPGTGTGTGTGTGACTGVSTAGLLGFGII